MVTDWILMRRVAVELERALKGGRVIDVGLLEDGRFAVRVGALRGRADATLAVEAFGSPPLATLTEESVSLAGDPGWSRAMSAALRGMRVAGVRARRGDRVLVVSFATTSRFGVESAARLVFELIPRYGNVLLLRDRTIVAAAKQFSPADNEARSIQIGAVYQPPPLPETSLNEAAFAAALCGDRRAKTRALGGIRPELPRLLAEAIVAESEAIPWNTAQIQAAWLLARAESILSSTTGESEGLGEVYAYFSDSALVQAHVLPLAQFGELRCEREPALLPLLGHARADNAAARRSSAVERRRHALSTRISKRLVAIERETAGVETKRADAAGRDALRAAGDALYTHAHEIPAGATRFVPWTQPEIAIVLDPDLDGKANAQAYFARYRKAADALPHLEKRKAALAARRSSFEDLAFETERADAAALDDIAAALDQLEGRRVVAQRAQTKARAILRVERPSGARILVGRSPRENVDVTFRLAKPDDLWFHARNVPGSHVVLQTVPGQAPNDEDIAAAADLAATHSRARSAPRVDIDFTERKHVRKQRDASPGMVWYTNARTRVGRPLPASG